MLVYMDGRLFTFLLYQMLIPELGPSSDCAKKWVKFGLDIREQKRLAGPAAEAAAVLAHLAPHADKIRDRSFGTPAATERA